ncbi:tetratricopeptide repeat protein [Cognatishimia sp. WU-CL00825]|uniref:tetratricopeptide repeat protein n=1 Tax=Cognatishimia sp. WU-CL00825 TaxID=3127658 RepID=UPI0033659F93
MLSINLKPIVAAAVVTFMCGAGSAIASDRLADLLTELQTAEPSAAVAIAKEIRLEWEKSGSAAADLLLKRGRDAAETGDFEDAIEHFTALVDHAPDFAEGRVARARAYVEVGLFGPAVADLEQALELNPQHFEAINGLGVILEMIDRPVEAYEAYLLVMAIHPTHPVVTEALQRLEIRAKGQKL